MKRPPVDVVVEHFTAKRVTTDPNPYHFAMVRAKGEGCDRTVEVVVSPSGRSIRVWIDGEEATT